MTDNHSEDIFTFTVLTAPVGAVDDTYRAGDEGLSPQSKAGDKVRRVLGLREKDVDVPAKDVRGFLQKQLVPLSSAIAQEAEKVQGGLAVDEISLTLGVGAEGGLSFVAKASAQASVTVTLRRK
jgi:hypothetical protein